jgi:hypothetical protein
LQFSKTKFTRSNSGLWKFIVTNVEKAQKHPLQPVAKIAQRKGTDKTAFQFADHRPAALAQRELQSSVAQGPQIQGLSVVQAMAQVQPKAQIVQRMTHAKGCSCGACGLQASVATMRPTLQAKAISASMGPVQLVTCPIHGTDADYDGHSDRKCPDMQEPEDDKKAEAAPVKEVEIPKKKGWQKQSGVKAGKSERDKRKRKGHGMMTKNQARRYVPNY